MCERGREGERDVDVSYTTRICCIINVSWKYQLENQMPLKKYCGICVFVCVCVCVCVLVPESCVPGGYGCVSHARSVFSIPVLVLSWQFLQTRVKGVRALCLTQVLMSRGDKCKVTTLFPVNNSIFFDAELSYCQGDLQQV